MTRQTLSLTVIALALAMPVLAQQGPDRPNRPGRPGAFGGPGAPGRQGGPGGPFSLLMMPEVQHELKLQDAQLTRIEQLLPARPGAGGSPSDVGVPEGGRRVPGEGWRNGPPAGGREGRAGEGMRQEMDQKLAEILDAGQLSRFKQLELQRAGGRALARKDLADTLELTEDQRREARDVVEGEREAMHTVFTTGPEGDPGAMRSKIRELRKSTDAKLDAILTEAQRKQLQALQGAAFIFPEPRMGPPGGGRGAERRPGGER